MELTQIELEWLHQWADEQAEPQSITQEQADAVVIGSSKVEIEGPLNIEADTLLTKRTRRPIAQWLEREGWKRDEPLQEGGEPYPIWPKARLFESAPPNSEDEEEGEEGGLKFVKGPTLEEEMRDEEPVPEKEGKDENFYTILGSEGEEECARIIGEGSREGETKVAIYNISPRGFPTEKVTNDSPTGDPEEQKGVTKEVDTDSLRRLIRWRDGFMGRVDREGTHTLTNGR